MQSLYISAKNLTAQHSISPLDLFSHIVAGRLSPLDAAGFRIPPPDVQKCVELRRHRADWASGVIPSAPGVDPEAYLNRVEALRGSLESWQGFSFEGLPRGLAFTRMEVVETIGCLSSDRVFFSSSEVSALSCGANENHESEIAKIRVEVLDETIELQRPGRRPVSVPIRRYFIGGKQKQLKILRDIVRDGQARVVRRENFYALQKKLVVILNENLGTTFPDDFKVFTAGANRFYRPKFRTEREIQDFPQNKAELLGTLADLLEGSGSEDEITALVNYGISANWLSDAMVRGIYDRLSCLPTFPETRDID